MRDVITAVFLTIIVGGFGFWVYNLYGEIGKLKEEQSVSISNGVLAEVQKFTFAEITNKYNYVHEKKWFLSRGIYEYRWSFTYQFGFEVPDNHDWGITHVGNETIRINVPHIQQMNNYDFDLEVARRLNKTMGGRTIEMEKEMKNIAMSIVKKSATEYLKNETIKKSVRSSLKSFFLSILREKNIERPISNIEIVFI